MCEHTKGAATEIGQQGVWGIMGISSVWGGVQYGRGQMKAPPHDNAYKEDVQRPHYS